MVNFKLALFADSQIDVRMSIYRNIDIDRPYFYVHPDTQCAPPRMYKCALRFTKQKLNNKPITRK
jgi:hypothetical protein